MQDYVVFIINLDILLIMVRVLPLLNGVLVIIPMNLEILMNNTIHYYNILLLIKTQCLEFIQELIVLVHSENIVVHPYVH